MCHPGCALPGPTEQLLLWSIGSLNGWYFPGSLEEKLSLSQESKHKACSRVWEKVKIFILMLSQAFLQHPSQPPAVSSSPRVSWPAFHTPLMETSLLKALPQVIFYSAFSSTSWCCVEKKIKIGRMSYYFHHSSSSEH